MFERDLLNEEKPKKYPFYHILFLIIIMFMLLISINTYDKYEIIAVKTNNQTFTATIPEYLTIDETSIIEKNNNKYEIVEVSYNNSFIENNEIYKEILITTNYSIKEDITKLNVLNNKQRIIKKIINIVKEK